MMPGLADLFANDGAERGDIRIGSVTSTSPLTVTLGGGGTGVASPARDSGYTPNTGDAVYCYLSKGRIIVLGSLSTASISGTYTPVWTASTLAPSIVNGTITGSYAVDGKSVTFVATVNFGTSTTVGSGNYSLSLPVAPLTGTRFAIPGVLVQGGASYAITAQVTGSTTAPLTYISSTASLFASVTPAAPVALTAAVGNGFQINGTYFTA